MVLNATLIISLWLQVFFDSNKRIVERVMSFEAVIHCTSLTTFFFIKYSYLKKRDLVVELFNKLVEFEKRHLLGKLLSSSKVMQLFL